MIYDSKLRKTSGLITDALRKIMNFYTADRLMYFFIHSLLTLWQVRKHVNDLYEDLRDGHNLISLLEVLSGETLVSIALFQLFSNHLLSVHCLNLKHTWKAVLKRNTWTRVQSLAVFEGGILDSPSTPVHICVCVCVLLIQQAG